MKKLRSDSVTEMFHEELGSDSVTEGFMSQGLIVTEVFHEEAKVRLSDRGFHEEAKVRLSDRDVSWRS